MSSCILPGSFDPVTNGHLNLIERVAGIFENVLVTVMINRGKSGCIPLEERVRMIRKACWKIPNVKVDMWDGLLSDYVRQHPGSVVVRGIRNVSEFEQEKTAAEINRQLLPGLETLLIPSMDDMDSVSSSTVREIASFRGDISRYIPDCIYPEVLRWLIPSDQRKQEECVYGK